MVLGDTSSLTPSHAAQVTGARPRKQEEVQKLTGFRVGHFRGMATLPALHRSDAGCRSPAQGLGRSLGDQWERLFC